MKMDPSLREALCVQINREYNAAYLYLSMSFYCHSENLPGFARWLRAQSHEECQHAEKISNHLLLRSESATLRAIEAPQSRWTNLFDLVSGVQEYEQSMTIAIHNLAVLANEKRDFPAQSLIRELIDEQAEEEAEIDTLVGQLRFVVRDPSAILALDREMARHAN